MSKFTTAVGRFLGVVKRYGWVVIGLAVVALALSAIASRNTTHVSTVRPVVLPLPDGSSLITPEQVLEKLSASFTKPLSALSLRDIDITRVERVLEAQAFVADADAYIDDDLQLNIIVTQRVPLLRVITDEGQNYYLDEDGVRMPLSENYTARVPVATGNIIIWSEDFMADPKHQLRHLVDLTHFVRKDTFLHALVEQIHIDEAGEYVLAPKVGDQLIFLGRYDRKKSPERLERLKVFYREGLPYEGWGKYRSFDLRYDDQVVAKKR